MLPAFSVAESCGECLSYGYAESQATVDRCRARQAPRRRESIRGDRRRALRDAGARLEISKGHRGTPRFLADYLDHERIGYAFMAPADVVFSPKRGVQPDLFVVPLVEGRTPDHFDEVRRLLLAVEALSPSTARTDRVEKRMLYRDEHVDEYWTVDLDSRIIERSMPSEPRPEILDSRLEWLPEGAADPLIIDLVGYFARVLDS